MEEVSFGLTGIAWNGGSRFWTGFKERKSILTKPEGLKWRRSVLAGIERFGLADVGFC
jgi:hypothetical protein